MTPARDPRKASFFKLHILPMLFVFLVPGFSAWFFGYAEASKDRSIIEEIAADIEASPRIRAEEKVDRIDFYRRLPPSRILASSDPELARLRHAFEPARFDYATFRWMKRIAWVCLATLALTFVIVGLSVWYSFRSHAAQYRALRVGWPVLQISASIQVLGQAVLAVALSYWVTALFMHTYAPKLIGLIGILAAIAVFTLFKAIFAQVDDRCQVTGERITDADAPRLWQNVRDFAERLGTAAPDQILVGIEPSFFVTEHPVIAGEQTYTGRTLFLSLPMLKVFTTAEANAVLGHELAHFSGEDTLWSRRISPLIGKFALYLQVLSEGFSAAVAQFMAGFWKLYNLSIRRLSRVREFRADRVGSELVSRDAMKRALIKITSYCDYRDETENAIIRQQRVDPTLDLSGRLESGYPAFLSGFAQSDKAVDERVPHPFDTHPTLHNRLAELGFEAQAALRDAEIQQPVTDSWYTAITTAPEVEHRLWTDRQEALKSFHARELAWRLLPADEEETRLVELHFPPAVFRDKKGREASLRYDRLQLPDWTDPILFKNIAKVEIVDSYGTKSVTLSHQTVDRPKPVKVKFVPAKFKGEGSDLYAAFSQYYSRHKTAESRQQPSQAV